MNINYPGDELIFKGLEKRNWFFTIPLKACARFVPKRKIMDRILGIDKYHGLTWNKIIIYYCGE
jgi:hypothetical protein